MPLFLKALRDYADWRLGISVLLILGLGLVETSGLLLLLPLLQQVGLDATPEFAAGNRLFSFINGLGLPKTLLGLLGLFLVIAVGQTVVKTILARLRTRVTSDFTMFLQLRLHRALMRAEWTVFLRQRSSDIVRVLLGEANQSGSAISSIIGLLGSVIQAIGQIIIAWLISPLVTVTSVFTGIVVVGLLHPLARRVRREGEANQVDRGALAANLTDHVSGLKLAKAHAAESRSAGAFRHLLRAMNERRIRIAVDQSKSQAGFSLGSSVALCGFVWFTAGYQGIRGAELALLALVFMRLASRMMAIQSNLQRIALLLPSFTAIENLRHEWDTVAEPLPINPASPPKLRLQRALELQQVSFAYPASDRTVVREITFALPAGRTTALCGPSGAGKSTLADLVLGLLPPSSGQIVIDGHPLAPTDLPAWRRAIAYVPQDVFLFNATIRANLIWLVESPAPTDAELWTVLEAAAAAELVRGLADGLDTEVGDRGVRLSGGERQRIALARALLRKPALLVLDEATSALDSTNEKIIQDAIDRLHGQMTILIIAHRLSTIRHADQIAVIESGHLVQSGTWDQLAAQPDGLFARMAATSFAPAPDAAE